jgi:signal transduction histidine kinase/CheY-like chemotaxis protein
MNVADSTQHHRGAVRRAPLLAGAGAALAGMLVLMGWALDIPALKSILPKFVPMLPATALGLALAGVALMLASIRVRWAFRAAQLLAVMVLFVGVQSFAEYLLEFEGPLRRVLFPRAPDGHLYWRYTMSQPAALAYVLFGACILLAGARKPLARIGYSGFATVGLLAGLGSALGYLYGAEAMLGMGGLQTIAVHAAIGLVTLFAGVLLLRPDIGWLGFIMGSRPAEIVGRSLLAVVIVLPVITAWLVQKGELAGLYDNQFRLALITLITIVLLSTLVLLFTRRTARLYETQLQTLEELHALEARHRLEADDANRRKDEFLATLSHELRNPLAPISAAAQVLERQAGEDPLLRQVSGILNRQSGHMARLVDDLLDVSRISRGHIELRKTRTLLAAVVESAIEASRPGIEAAGHALSISLPAEPVEVEVDGTRMSQVIQNLVNNAVKFTPPGGQIRISGEASGEQAVILVRDSGMGMDPESIDAIFEMFHQATNGSGRGSGLGIGLALAKALVEQHGGSISASSEGTGRGSEFRITIPRASPLYAVANDPVAAKDDAGAGASRPAPRRVLLVDDNQDAVEMLAAYLRLKGYEARTAGDGPAALALAGHFDADVAVLDIGLPGMSGYELARRMRSDWPVQPLTILALTGWGQLEDKQRAREAGFDHHFTKPIDLVALLEWLSPAR